jgi:hypothetical protein
MTRISVHNLIISIAAGCSILSYTVTITMNSTDTFDIFDMSDELFAMGIEDTAAILQRRNCEPPPPDVIVEILQTTGVISILEETLYKKTNVPNDRSLDDYPAFEPSCFKLTPGWAAGFDTFWNQTHRMNLTWGSNHISSYLALDELSLIRKLEAAIDTIAPIFVNPNTNFDLKKVLALTSNISVAQRRTGFMLHGTRTWESLRVRFFCPLYYLERNFFLSNAERDEIAAEFGLEGQEEDTTFQDRYLVSDKFGFGDTRIEVDNGIYRGNTTQVRAGFLATIPTAFTLASGIKGSSFKKTACLPQANIFESLFCIALSNQSEKSKTADGLALLRTFGLGALDRLSANLLDAPLGNGGHIGIGALLRFETDLNKLLLHIHGHEFDWRNRVSLEYQFPANEKRFFVEKNNLAAFNARDFSNTSDADSNLTFLEEELVNRLYPVAFDALIQPGIIFRLDTRLCYHLKQWGILFGSDLWAQSRGHFKSVDVFGRLGNQIDTCKAEASGAYQIKLFGGLNYTLERPKRTWVVSLDGDATIANGGIGKDYSIVFNVETHF